MAQIYISIIFSIVLYVFSVVVQDGGMDRPLRPGSRRLLRVGGACLLVLLLVSCGEELVFQNEFDPQASNSPLGSSIQPDMGPVDDGNETNATLSWAEVATAVDYEYQVAEYFGFEDRNLSFEQVAENVFEDVGAGTITPVATAVTPAGGAGTFNTTANVGGAGLFAIRVRYSAQATNAGVTSTVFGPWSDPVAVELGVATGYWRTEFINAFDVITAGFEYRGQKRIYEFGPVANGNSPEIFISDEWTGRADGADPIVQVFEKDNTFAGTVVEVAGPIDKIANPVTFTNNQGADRNYFVVLESDNPGFTTFQIQVNY